MRNDSFLSNHLIMCIVLIQLLTLSSCHNSKNRNIKKNITVEVSKPESLDDYVKKINFNCEENKCDSRLGLIISKEKKSFKMCNVFSYQEDKFITSSSCLQLTDSQEVVEAKNIRLVFPNEDGTNQIKTPHSIDSSSSLLWNKYITISIKNSNSEYINDIFDISHQGIDKTDTPLIVSYIQTSQYNFELSRSQCKPTFNSLGWLRAQNEKSAEMALTNCDGGFEKLLPGATVFNSNTDLIVGLTYSYKTVKNNTIEHSSQLLDGQTISNLAKVSSFSCIGINQSTKSKRDCDIKKIVYSNPLYDLFTDSYSRNEVIGNTSSIDEHFQYIDNFTHSSQKWKFIFIKEKTSENTIRYSILNVLDSIDINELNERAESKICEVQISIDQNFKIKYFMIQNPCRKVYTRIRRSKNSSKAYIYTYDSLTKGNKIYFKELEIRGTLI